MEYLSWIGLGLVGLGIAVMLGRAIAWGLSVLDDYIEEMK